MALGDDDGGSSSGARDGTVASSPWSLALHSRGVAHAHTRRTLGTQQLGSRKIFFILRHDYFQYLVSLILSAHVVFLICTFSQTAPAPPAPPPIHLLELRLTRAVRVLRVAARTFATTADFTFTSIAAAASVAASATSANDASDDEELLRWLGDPARREHLLEALCDGDGGGGGADAIDGVLVCGARDTLILLHAPFSPPKRNASVSGIGSASAGGAVRARGTRGLLQLVDADKRVGCAQMFISDIFARMRLGASAATSATAAANAMSS